MKITYVNDTRDTITIERQGPDLYRIWGAKSNGKWREWKASSQQIPNIGLLVSQLEILGNIVVEEVG